MHVDLRGFTQEKLLPRIELIQADLQSKARNWWNVSEVDEQTQALVDAHQPVAFIQMNVRWRQADPGTVSSDLQDLAQQSVHLR